MKFSRRKLFFVVLFTTVALTMLRAFALRRSYAMGGGGTLKVGSNPLTGVCIPGEKYFNQPI